METKFEFAKQIVQEAADYILAHMKEDLQVERKSSPTDLVTRLDKEVQDLLVRRILASYPEDLICAEEGVCEPRLKRVRFGSLIPLMGPIILSPSRKILP